MDMVRCTMSMGGMAEGAKTKTKCRWPVAGGRRAGSSSYIRHTFGDILYEDDVSKIAKLSVGRARGLNGRYVGFSLWAR